ncbi:MAG: hypothetical protein MJ057_08665, partial [Sphaerochaetaceae bacterium]|nr:hypothetical protein [Sphaerochaetaceae bacterium]
ATEEVVEVTVEVEEVSETVPVEVEISVEPAPEPVEIEIETIPASEAVEVEVEKAETSEPVAIAVETKAPKAEAKDLFKSCSFSSGIVPYSYQKLYTEDTSLITGVGFKASAFKYFKSHYVALGLEYTGITHQYETKSFSDQKGLLKFRTYIPFNKSGESMMFVSSGIGGALITENNGQTKLFGLVAADLGVSFRLADDLALEISTNAVAAFRRYLRSIEVDASVAMTYHF